MTNSDRIIVTGAAGYIGSVVSRMLLQSNFEVFGLDNLSRGSHAILPLMTIPGFSFLKADITDFDAIKPIIREVCPFAIVHLAAIVGDPACKAASVLANRTNFEATRNLYSCAVDSNVATFIFSSTCSNYGLSASSEPLDEEAPLNPLSLYAETKVAAETWLLENSTASTFPILLRFGTAHGLSSRMRFDLTVNEFARAIAEGRRLEIYDAETWRPYCHVNDFAMVIAKCLTRNNLHAGNHVFNIGADRENYRKIDLLTTIAEAIGVSPDYINIGDGMDRRNYRVSFARAASHLGFAPQFNVRYSAQQIAQAVQHGMFSCKEVSYGNV